MSREYFNKSIVDLENLFEENFDNPSILKKLSDELEHREAKRALVLKAKVNKVLAGPIKDLYKKIEPGRIQVEISPEELDISVPAETSNFKTQEISLPFTLPAPPAITNSPSEILKHWIAQEVLSPPSFNKPENLANGVKSRIALLKNGLPWIHGEPSKPKQVLYYQVILGTIELQPAVKMLLDVYSDSREDFIGARGETVIATIMVDKHGKPIEKDPISIASFAWGFPKALIGRLSELGEWATIEKTIIEALTKRLVQPDSKGEPKPLDLKIIETTSAWLSKQLNLPESVVKKPEFLVRTYQFFTLKTPPEALLLNSFFLKDLLLAKEMVVTNTATPNLLRYLGMRSVGNRKNLMLDNLALSEALEPAKFPKGSWPAYGRHPLVLLQQVAVNLTIDELATNGISAINGPPGTGKTTLLRDIFAAVITSRAEQLATFDDPESAFKKTGETVKRNSSLIDLYLIDPKLVGYEMIVASSNNKAVENVSAELPSIDAIAFDAFELRYFKSISDNVLKRNTWGMVAAVLGNGENKNEFKKSFWADEDLGMNTYLRAAAGQCPEFVDNSDPANLISRKPHVVTMEHPPKDKKEALNLWRMARENFKAALAKVEKLRHDIQLAYTLMQNFNTREQSLINLTDQIHKTQLEINRTTELVSHQKNDFTHKESLKKKAEQLFERNLSTRPSFLKRLFRTEDFKVWRQEDSFRENDLRDKKTALNIARESFHEISHRLKSLQDKNHQILKERDAIALKLKNDKATCEAILKTHTGITIDESFFELAHRDKQMAAPWLDQAMAKSRQDLFEMSIKLHKAFIDAAALPIRHNLNVFFETYGVRSLGSLAKDKVLPSLWSTFSLVVPLFSTTFASISKMLSKVGREELGWLLIDEAGQALPQSAVGAIIRTKRAVVVGDPIQIEPIVTLPEKLTESICLQFGVDPNVYNAPSASAQTLADSATPFYGTFQTVHGAREVGIPLLVHRRCSSPMFNISNGLAYEGQMVQAKQFGVSPIKEILGESRWISLQSSGSDKWSEKEGMTVLDMLRQLKDAGIKPDIYIVTPFVVVQDSMRTLIRTSGVLDNWVDNPAQWPYERVGTVHTVQGREAEAIIFILGAPNQEQRGARAWAGSKPNLLNVAITRSKEALYVVGNRNYWRDAGVFQKLAEGLISSN
ncbi:MAG TPA: ATP-binding protein [Methylophilaceae bacterium]|nr:ATP-binding protein [Methylophilaceae bacterium]